MMLGHRLADPWMNTVLTTALSRTGRCDCRRGACLSCAARVVGGTPWALRCDSLTALCPLGHEQV